MRIAILADIHANLFALDAVIDDLDRQNVDEVLIGGDIVGRGPMGSAAIKRIQERGWNGVRGNHEDYLLSFHHNKIPEEWHALSEWSAARWMAKELDDESIQFIDALPFSRTSSRTNELRLVHGSPRSHTEGIGPWTPEEDVEHHLASVDEKIIICAHTHRPMERHTASGLVVNVGSVGLPFNADNRAQYAILTHQNNAWSVEFRQVPYDREAFVRYYKTSGFSELGGVTAALLLLEIEHARPFLVPFLRWAKARELPVATEHLPEFLQFFDHQQPLSKFFAKL